MGKISDAFLIILLGAIWLGPPTYWGYINGSLLATLIWPVMAAFTVVGTGWRFRKRSAFISFLYGLVFAAIGVVPVYFLGRAIDLFW
jgi:predicted PurR-regulated permease PerM